MPAEQLAPLLSAAEAAGVPARREDATVERLRRKATVLCLAQVRKRPERLAAELDHVVLVNPSHPGNVGTAIRSLVAFDLLDLALVAPRLDEWGAYVVRASVGLRFALRCKVFGSLGEYLDEHCESAEWRGAPLDQGAPRPARRNLYLFDAQGERELDEVRFLSPFALVFGPEWSAERLDAVTDAKPTWSPTASVRIPQGNQVESLNLATSVSIAAYSARRPQRDRGRAHQG
jgi:TrmH family RNA methyltransferase